MATVIGVIGDGDGGGGGRVVSRELVVNRTIEGEMTLSMRSAVSVAAANMVGSVVAGCREKERKKGEKKRKRKVPFEPR